jgi:type IV pilus assembly protein PilM
MNSAKTTKKKLSEYQVEDLKEIFLDVFKKISSKIILLEIGSDFVNIGLAKSQKNKLYIKKILRQSLPEEALDKSIPTDPVSFGSFLKEIINENKFNTNRVAVVLPSDTCYTRLIEIPENVEENNSTSFLENPNSGIQIPISLENSDFEINLTNLPKKEYKNKIFNKYFLTSIPKKNLDIVLDAIKNANLEICSVQMSHMCIANLLKSEINKLKEEDLIISIDLLDEFSQFVIFDRSGPLLIKRLASIRNYPSIEEMKKINTSNNDKSMNSKDKSESENYHVLSKLDLKVLLREIKESFNSFLSENNLNKKGKIFLSGRNSQHKNLVELIGKNLMMDVALVSPINNNLLKEFSYNPDEINQFSMSRIVGLGITLMKDIGLVDDTTNREFIIQNFFFEDFKKVESKNIKKNENNNENNNESKNNENYTITNIMNSLNKFKREQY